MNINRGLVDHVKRGFSILNASSETVSSEKENYKILGRQALQVFTKEPSHRKHLNAGKVIKPNENKIHKMKQIPNLSIQNSIPNPSTVLHSTSHIKNIFDRILNPFPVLYSTLQPKNNFNGMTSYERTDNMQTFPYEYNNGHKTNDILGTGGHIHNSIEL